MAGVVFVFVRDDASVIQLPARPAAHKAILISCASVASSREPALAECRVARR